MESELCRKLMKYMLTWTERPQGSPMEYEDAQKRILEVFTQWKVPAHKEFGNGCRYALVQLRS